MKIAQVTSTFEMQITDCRCVDYIREIESVSTLAGCDASITLANARRTFAGIQRAVGLLSLYLYQTETLSPSDLSNKGDIRSMNFALHYTRMF